MVISKVITFDLFDTDINTAATGVWESFKKELKMELKFYASVFKGLGKLWISTSVLEH